MVGHQIPCDAANVQQRLPPDPEIAAKTGKAGFEGQGLQGRVSDRRPCVKWPGVRGARGKVLMVRLALWP